MTEHVVPIEGAAQGLVVLQGRTDTIRTTSPVILGLDSFGFARLTVSWRRHAPPACVGCVACAVLGSSTQDPVARHADCDGLPHCGACDHHACPLSGA